MATASEIREQIKKEKAGYAAGVRQFEAENWDRMLPTHRFQLRGMDEATVYVFGDGSFRVSDEQVYEDADRTMELFRSLKEFIEPIHPEFYAGFESLKEKEDQVNLILETDAILSGIENGLDRLPDLHEILNGISECMNKGSDLKTYLSERRNAFRI